MSYVQLNEVGCSQPETPWDFYAQGPGTMFNHPQTVATQGKATNASPGAVSGVGQAFYAEQVKLGGWSTATQSLYNTLGSTAYGGSFLPQAWNVGMHVTQNGDLNNYNLGQIYLANAMSWTFLEWSEDQWAYQPFNRNDPDSIYVPVFLTPLAQPIGLANIEEFKRGTYGKKYGMLLTNAIAQARSAQDALGPCGKVLRFYCTIMDRREPGWTKNVPGIGEWWDATKFVLSGRN